MLAIDIKETELWDEEREELVHIKPVQLHLEHSLIAISRWESKWHKSFISDGPTNDEMFDYIRCMSLKEIDPIVLKALRQSDIDKITKYITDPMTATTIKETGNKHSNQKITNELIYYWMIQYGIPHEFEKWHINRLIMLIRVCSEESKPSKKRSNQEIARSYRELNNARLAKYKTRG